MNDWIPVTERLPERGDKVDIWIDGHRVTDWWLDWYAPDDEELFWYSGRSNIFEVESIPHSVGKITHWMPLPPPPENDDE